MQKKRRHRFIYGISTIEHKEKHQQQEYSIWSHTEQIILTISCILTRMKNWWHVRCVNFMSKLLIYKQLRLSYSKLSVLIFAIFQFFMFWLQTGFVKWKSEFRNSLFDLKWKIEFQKIYFIFQIWLKHWKRKNEKKYSFLTLFWFKINFKKQISKFLNSFFVFKSKNELYFRYTDSDCS